MMRRTRSSAGASTATVQAHSRSRPLSTRLMASSPTRDCPAARRISSGGRYSYTMALSRSRAAWSENTKVPSFCRSRLPSGQNTGPKAAVIASRRAGSVRSIWWYTASQSSTVPPRSTSAARALVFPAPVPPVRPTISGRSASIRWKPAAFFSRLATASPRPPSSGHWAKISVTSVPSKVRRASNTWRAWADLSAAGPSLWMMCPGKRGAYSSKQITPAVSDSSPWMRRALRSGSPVTTVTGACGA